MTKKKWFILIAVVLALGLMGLTLALVLAFGFVFGREEATVVGSGLPVYTTEQSASSHAGYRHSTLTCGRDVYVSDYEEACLQLAYPDPQSAVGRMGLIGNAKVCEIRGQPATAYVAGDVGSEMPAYVPYRNIQQPPFDWRTATFREMSAHGPNQSSSYRVTTDHALIAEVVHLLRNGTPVELPDITFVNAHTNLYTLKLASDQLPGLLFCPPVCVDAHGQFYLAESLMLDYTAPNPPQLHSRWIPASEKLAEWLKMP